MKTIIVHNGPFHADELVAVALLRAFVPGWDNAKIVRTRDKTVLEEGKLDPETVLIDVGLEFDHNKKAYDHHQKNPPLRENGEKYASAGLVWDSIKKQDGPRAKEILDGIVEKVDKSDTGTKVPGWSFSLDVHKCNPVQSSDFDERFEKLVEILMEIFAIVANENAVDINESFVCDSFRWHPQVTAWIGEHNRALAESETRVRAVMETATDLLVFDKYEPALLDIAHEAPESVRFSIYPNPSGEWMIQQIPVMAKSFEGRMKLPSGWWAKQGPELDEVTNIPDCVFCHNTGFIGAHKTRSGAEAMAKLAISLQ